MSTRATLFFKDDIHIYEELMDGYVYVEFEKDGFLANIRLMAIPEWRILTNSPAPIADVRITCSKCGNYHSVYVGCDGAALGK